MSIDLQWIEMSGTLHEKLVPHSSARPGRPALSIWP
jgi:hypothetical protein